MNTPNSKKDEKRYFQLSPDTVPLLAETVGINGNSISPSVSRALAEDVSYRCRELANVSFFIKLKCRAVARSENPGGGT